jgi:hypothetical protein
VLVVGEFLSQRPADVQTTGPGTNRDVRICLAVPSGSSLTTYGVVLDGACR